jgi:hypothetical protein
VLGVLAGTYQPLAFGHGAGGQFPGLPAGVQGQYVNTFGGQLGGYYVPLQRGTFTILSSIQSTGPSSVTIESVSIFPPGSPTNWPLRPAGQVLYVPEILYQHQRIWTSGRPVHGLSLGPNEAIAVGIPVRMAYPCYLPGSSTGVGVFYVREKYLTFTHWVAISVGTPLSLREPEPAGSGMDCEKQPTPRRASVSWPSPSRPGSGRRGP